MWDRDSVRARFSLVALTVAALIPGLTATAAAAATTPPAAPPVPVTGCDGRSRLRRRRSMTRTS